MSKRLSKKILVPVTTLVVLVTAGLIGTKIIKADENNTYPPIVQKLAERFNLNENDVKKVFDEERQQHQEDRKAQLEEGLDKAVADGVITEEQKQLLLDREQNMQQVREQNREEMDSWFQDNGIDQNKLSSYIGFMGKGPGRGSRQEPVQ